MLVGIPKPAPRGPKKRKPLPRVSQKGRRSRASTLSFKTPTFFARKTPLKTMRTSDLASFDKEDLAFIHGSFPRCFFLPIEQAHDYHHIVGRGTMQERKLFSSVFNACPITRKIHDTCPLLTLKPMKQCLLDHAIKHVLNAAGRGSYELKENDLLFLGWCRSEGYDVPALTL